MLKAPEVIGFLLVLTFVFNLLGIYSLTYLFVGFVLPAACRYKDIKIFHYWECFAILLFMRQVTDAFQTLDVILQVSLGSIIGAALASQLQIRPETNRVDQNL